MTGPGVAFMTYVPELKLIYYADKGSNILKVYTFDCKPYTRLDWGARYSPGRFARRPLSFLLMFFKCFLTFVVVYLVVVFQLVEEDLCVPPFDLLRRR